MGTDIHMACEVRRNGKWELVKDKVFKNSWYVPDSKYSFQQDEFTYIPYDSRCYNLFAILANVRNGLGFAGIKIGEPFNPISTPKGYPDDMCEELNRDVNNEYEEGAFDNRPTLSGDHSGSWLTLKELLDYDWEQTHRDYGCVNEDTYRDYIMKGIHPESWSGNVSGPSIVHISEKEMVDLIQERYARKGDKQYYTHCYFTPKTYKDASGGFYDDVIPVLQTLIPDGGTAEDVRLIFDFDS